MKNNITFSLSLLALSCLQANAAPTTTNPPSAVTAAGTDYTAFVGESYIDLGDALESTRFADMLMCIVGAGGSPLLPTETYNAVADFGLCGAGEKTKTSYSSMTIESSRTSDVAPQNVKMWIDYKPGTSIPVMGVHMKAQISAEPTATNHLGVWQIDWEFQNLGPNQTDNGHLKASVGAAGFSEFTLASQTQGHGGGEELRYSKTQMTSLTDGIGRSTISLPPSSSLHRDWAIAFNDSLLSIKDRAVDDPDPATCHNLQILTDEVSDYNLYDSSGALVDVKAELNFTTLTGNSGTVGSYKYVDADDASELIGYWVWIDQNDYPASSASTTVSTTVSDSDTPTTKYTITWDITVGAAGVTHAVTAVADGPAGSGGSAHVFDLPIIFDTSSAQLVNTISPLTERNDSTSTLTRSNFYTSSMKYNGRGRLWGISQNGDNRASFADGTALRVKDSPVNDSVHRGETYYVKAVSVARTPATAAAAECSVLNGPLATGGALGLPTQADVTNNSPSLGNRPSITAEPRIKDGVLITD